jgi:hypothetical protein
MLSESESKRAELQDNIQQINISNTEENEKQRG